MDPVQVMNVLTLKKGLKLVILPETNFVLITKKLLTLRCHALVTLFRNEQHYNLNSKGIVTNFVTLILELMFVLFSYK